MILSVASTARWSRSTRQASGARQQRDVPTAGVPYRSEAVADVRSTPRVTVRGTGGRLRGYGDKLRPRVQAAGGQLVWRIRLQPRSVGSTVGPTT
jgi:hypothetical protein